MKARRARGPVAGFVADVLAAAVAELRAIRADRGALTVLVAATLLYAVLYPVPYRRQLARDLPILVVDEDATAASRQLGRLVDAAEQVAVVGTVGHLPEAAAMVRAGKVYGVVVVPAGFERRILRGERAVVGAYGDARVFMVYSQIASGVAAAVGTFSAGVELRRLEAAGMGRPAAQRARDPLPLVVRALYNPSGGYGNAVVPAVLVVILQQTLLVGMGMLAGTRREQARGGHAAAANGNVLARVLGQASAYVGLYAAHATAFFLIAYRLYDLPRQGSAARAGLFLLPFLFAVAFLGLATSRLFRERESALQLLLVTSLPAIFVSGFSFPAEAMPGWVRAIASLLPSTHGIAGMVRVLQTGATLGEVRGAWLALWALAASYLALACAAARPRRARTASRLPDAVRADRGP